MVQPPRTSKNLLVLGGGLEPDGRASAGTIARADRAADYYWEHQRDIGRIICCGAYSASMPEPPPEGVTEAWAMAVMLRGRDVPEGVIVPEDESTTSFESIKKVMERGFLTNLEINEEHPLGIVTVRPHYWRVKPIAQKGFGLESHEVQNIRVEEQLGLTSTLVQGVGALATHAALLGIPANDLQGIDRAHRRFARTFHRPV